MAEELLEFENTVEDGDGKSWVAVVMGAEREDSHWIGGIRFDPADGGEALVADRETTQPNRDDLVYWSTGLTYFYLEGALARARGKRSRDRASGAANDAAASAAREDSNGARTGGGPDRGLPQLEVASLDHAIAEEIMGVRDPRPGTIRKVRNAGLVATRGRPRTETACGTGSACRRGTAPPGRTWPTGYGAGCIAWARGRR